MNTDITEFLFETKEFLYRKTNIDLRREAMDWKIHLVYLLGSFLQRTAQALIVLALLGSVFDEFAVACWLFVAATFIKLAAYTGTLAYQGVQNLPVEARLRLDAASRSIKRTSTTAPGAKKETA